ncbi:tRNA (guanine) methyltransferase [Saccharomyces eubayanus]|uniref:tRNA (guanine) methyltransferase n=1 Tax=Saccharomyces eubayanus TaxID=1080349 RepID=UPI0006C267F1|nr:TRM5-like protein [Saccharomyces eubayanus]KOG99133.1 TRM5-like protein [Saccharomyces eubayanus]
MKTALPVLQRVNKLIRSCKMSGVFPYSPPVNREMRELDRSFFITRIPMCAVKFPEPKNISTFSKNFKDCILRVPRIPHVVKLSAAKPSEEPTSVQNKKLKTADSDNGTISKGVLLHDSIHSVEEAYAQLPAEALDFLKENRAEILAHEYVLDYDFWKAEEILRAVLPEEFLEEIPTGFTITGHIAHLNLRSEFKPFDSLIGQVILDKNNKIECVVDKVSSIATQFRTFPMKVIAGKSDSLVVEQRESNCTFRFDFSKVYWNSRLHTEHERLVKQYFQPGQVVCDVFAGVGPFAVPAGKKDVIVLANDLNPESYKSLQENIALNKVAQTVKSFNMDGAEFIRRSPELLQQWIKNEEDGTIKIPVPARKRHRSQQQQQQQQQPRFKEVPIPARISHYVMNLPDSAISFLGNFRGIFAEYAREDGNNEMPWVHVHCFEKYPPGEEVTEHELHERVHARIVAALQVTAHELPLQAVALHLVRKVAPTKPMYCASFQLPAAV